MDNYIVSARKYRPATFQSVVGQKALTATLKNAIATNKLAHAYLFSGPRGVGKTTCARIFAKTINCLQPTSDHEACNACESCAAFNEQRSYNIHELDAASNNGVDDIRSLIDQVRIPPQIGKYKVYIIDEVHMLSTAAFNSFLKTLEEPPHHAVFVLATTEKHKILPTILSRCQVYDFSRIGVSDIVEHLQYVAEKEEVKTEKEALSIIAQKADGGMRDALSIFDQTVSFTDGDVTYKAVIESLNVLDYAYYFRLTDAILRANVVDCLLILNEILRNGFEGQSVITGAASHFRDLLLCKDVHTANLLQVGTSLRQRYIDTAQKCSNKFLYDAIDLANSCDLNYRLSKNRRLLLELTFIKLCQLIDSPQQDEEADKKKIKPITTSKSTEPKTYPEKQSDEARKRASEPKPEVITPPKPEEKSPETPTQKAATPQKNVSDLGVSISGIAGAKSVVQNPFSKTKDEKFGNTPFTEAQLIIHWKSFANQLNEELLLQKTMLLNLPKMISESNFCVEVSAATGKQFLEDNSGAILLYLRKSLKNDAVMMSVIISEDTGSKRPTTPREIFDEMAVLNPSLQKLSDELGLELK